MVKLWADTYRDLNPFDTLYHEELLDRAVDTLKFYDQEDYVRQRDVNNAAFLGIKSHTVDDYGVEYFHKKYNGKDCAIPTETQIVLRQFRPSYSRPEYETVENTKIFRGLTSNVNNRDGFIVAGFSVKTIEGTYLNPIRFKETTGQWLYLNLPGELVYNYLDKSINSAPLTIAKQFIEEIDNSFGWDNLKLLELKIEEYDNLYPNWNHDFPIKSFVQVKKDGILFPCVWFHSDTILSEGTHRLVMSGFNKFDIPYFLPIPKFSPYIWNATSREPMFLVDGKYQYLNALIDRKLNKVEYSFVAEKDYAKKENIKLGYNDYYANWT